MKDRVIGILIVVIVYLLLTIWFTSMDKGMLIDRAINVDCAKYIVDEKTGETQFVFKGEEDWVD